MIEVGKTYYVDKSIMKCCCNDSNKIKILQQWKKRPNCYQIATYLNKPFEDKIRGNIVVSKETINKAIIKEIT